jgi:16S rRNA C1402 (ribose-2'-O) methylase RsmI
VPPLTERLDQLEYLCENFDAKCINWRFDPICFYKTKNKTKDNLHDLPLIADRASSCGITRCITGFMDYYKKIHKRTALIEDFSFVYPSLEKKRELILSIEKRMSSAGINLYACCEKELMDILPESSGIKNSSCIPNDFLIKIYGGKLSLGKDFGQRIKQGCGCRISTDIGSYTLHPCYHNCLFCYANPCSDS